MALQRTGMSIPTSVAGSFGQSATAAAALSNDGARLLALTDAIERDQLATSFTAQIRAGKRITVFGDYSLAKVARDEANRRRWMQMLKSIDPSHLTPIDRETYGIVQFDLHNASAGEIEYWLTFDLTAYQAPMAVGFVNQLLTARPLGNAAEAAEYLRLVNLYAAMIESLVAKVGAQTVKGIYLPKPALPVVRRTWVDIAAGLDLLCPSDARLSKLGGSSRARLVAGIDAVVAKRIKPSFAKLNTILGPDYESKAPEAVGLGQYPNGKALYAKLIQRYTTLPLTPDQVRTIGENDVAEVSTKMAAIRKQFGSNDTARVFYDKLSADPRFLARTTDDVEATYNRYIGRIVSKLPDYFLTLPKAPYGVQRLPLEAEAGQTFGYYNPPTGAETRGLYYYNGSQLDKRSMINAGTLIYHELMPGHHMQIAIQEENAALSPYRKRYEVGAFSEGWAEYAASLGIEMGLYDTPEALYGRYVNEMFLTARLIVDTGMNYFGWPLEKAQAYMRENTSLSDVEIDSETLRYSTSIPGQALGYRIGYVKFWELRQKAEKALGPKFDLRQFHDIALLPGARPLDAVEKDIDAYIAGKK